jgi:hypothetical protein
MIDIFVATIIVCIILLYVLYKERCELGCKHLSIHHKCDFDDSVYIKNTKLEKNDNCQDLLHKLESIVSYHEKGGIWKRCIIIATICVSFIFVVYKINSKFDSIYHYILLLLLIFTVIYLYHNFINYHQFRILKNNTLEIINQINKKCYK